MITLLISLLLAAPSDLSQDSVAMETGTMTSKIHDLPDFTVRSKKLTSSDIIDSILYYEPENNFYPEVLESTISGILTRNGDTLFHAVTDSVFFCRNKSTDRRYTPRIRPGTHSLVDYNPFQKKALARIVDVVEYIPQRSFASKVSMMKSNIKKNGDLFGVSVEAGKRLHHILIKNGFTTANGPGISYSHLVIESNGWKMLGTTAYCFETNDSIVRRLDTIKSFRAAMALIESEIAIPKRVRFIASSQFAYNDQQKLVPSRFFMDDNLFYVLNSFMAAQFEKDGSMYLYEVKFEDNRIEKPRGSLVKFGVYEWMNPILKP